MGTTRGNLEPAIICEVNRKGNPRKNGLAVSCMFNPYEYRVSKSNSFRKKPKKFSNVPQVEFFTAGEQTLNLSLIFDTYETGDDVSKETEKLWKFMLVRGRKQSRKGKMVKPPQVAFIWGVFKFVAFITSITQSFTLFKSDGTPVRAKVDLTFTQYTDVEDYDRQNPTSGGGPTERIWRVTTGDRLDLIAAEVYDDATEWRLIAQHNDILDPLALRPGQELRIPLD